MILELRPDPRDVAANGHILPTTQQSHYGMSYQYDLYDVLLMLVYLFADIYQSWSNIYYACHDH